MSALAPTLAAANRIIHGAYPATLEGRQQREIDVQLVAGAYILAANARAAIQAEIDAWPSGHRAYKAGLAFALDALAESEKA